MKIVTREKLIAYKSKNAIVCVNQEWKVPRNLTNKRIFVVGNSGKEIVGFGKSKQIVYYYQEKGGSLAGKTLNGEHYYFYRLTIPVKTFFENMGHLWRTSMLMPYFRAVVEDIHIN